MRTTQHLCGFTFWHPGWLQKYANSKSFLLIYGFLGTVQAMAGLYFLITLTTLEKRFKIPSQTTGKILSVCYCVVCVNVKRMSARGIMY